MASPSLAIAKASLAASMMRPDPISLPGPELVSFQNSLEEMLEYCSSTRIQLCKYWLLKNIATSPGRIAALGKYLVALSRSVEQADGTGFGCPSAKGTPAQRKQLHILYLLNDILHHAKYHDESFTASYALVSNLQPHVSDLFKLVSAYGHDEYALHHKRVLDLLDLWAEVDYFEGSYIQNLREIASEATRTDRKNGEESKSNLGVPDNGLSHDPRNAQYIMPASHGDSSTPFYDLPAGNMMPHIIPNSSSPINSQVVKPLQFAAGRANENLAAAVESFLDDITASNNLICAGKRPLFVDVDELGDCEIRGSSTIKKQIEGYYGWSREFCQMMKAGGALQPSGKAGSPTRSEASEFGRPKRRRYSYIQSKSDSSRSRSHSGYNIASPERDESLRSRSKSASPPSPSRTDMIPTDSIKFTATSQTPSGSGGPSPSHDSHLPPLQSIDQTPPASQYLSPSPSSVPLISPCSSVLTIPPRPPGYNGPWPPPPPPPPTPPPPQDLLTAQQFDRKADAFKHQKAPTAPNIGDLVQQPPRAGLAFPYETSSQCK